MTKPTVKDDHKRFLLSLAYDGRNFEGWQSQLNGNTIQDHLLKALKGVCPLISSVQGAGRTDSGVSALAQRAHFDAPGSTRLDSRNWQQALNAHLPPQIRVMRCEKVSSDFHARFDASGKHYCYRIYTGGVLPPLQYGLAWQVKGNLDISRLQKTLGLFVGRHDYRAFAANRGDGQDESRDAYRTIQSAALITNDDPLDIELQFIGEGFLYKMARFMVGSAIKSAQGKLSLDAIQRLLAGVPFPEKAPFCAPPDGLILKEVFYPGNKSMTSSSSSS